jgi:hypothetical protein
MPVAGQAELIPAPFDQGSQVGIGEQLPAEEAWPLQTGQVAALIRAWRAAAGAILGVFVTALGFALGLCLYDHLCSSAFLSR